MEWFKPSEKLPPQGKKILYLDRGDIYVVQRYKDLWVPIPFVDSKYAFFSPPEYWANITDLPNGLTGKLRIFCNKDNTMYFIDEFEEKFPEEYQIFYNATKKAWAQK